jgi:predicted permease
MIGPILSTMFDVLVPLSLPVLAGFFLVRIKHIETKHILVMVLYFFTPVMVFHTLSTAEISPVEISQTLKFCALNLFFMWALAQIIGKFLKLGQSQLAGFTLVSVLTNAVNYGLPLVLLSFGALGLDKASVYVIIQILVTNTFGVYFAARSSFSLPKAVGSVFKLPAVYAAVAAVLVRGLGFSVPANIAKGFAMTAQAYSPLVLTVLGTQIAGVKNVRLVSDVQRAFIAGLFVRLALSPVMAFAALRILGIEGILFSVLLILASMPVSVNSVILAERFDASPELVSKCILWTTLASFIVLPVLIEFIRIV